MCDLIKTVLFWQTWLHGLQHYCSRTWSGSWVIHLPSQTAERDFNLIADVRNWLLSLLLARCLGPSCWATAFETRLRSQAKVFLPAVTLLTLWMFEFNKKNGLHCHIFSPFLVFFFNVQCEDSFDVGWKLYLLLLLHPSSSSSRSVYARKPNKQVCPSCWLYTSLSWNAHTADSGDYLWPQCVWTRKESQKSS